MQKNCLLIYISKTSLHLKCTLNIYQQSSYIQESALKAMYYLSITHHKAGVTTMAHSSLPLINFCTHQLSVHEYFTDCIGRFLNVFL